MVDGSLQPGNAGVAMAAGMAALHDPPTQPPGGTLTCGAGLDHALDLLALDLAGHLDLASRALRSGGSSGALRSGGSSGALRSGGSSGALRSGGSVAAVAAVGAVGAFFEEDRSDFAVGVHIGVAGARFAGDLLATDPTGDHVAG